MKSFHRFCAFPLLFTAIALNGMFYPAWAQPSEKILPQSQWKVIQLHNVRPDIMAYWLDAQHTSVPLEYRNQSATSLQRLPAVPAPDPAFKGETYQIIVIDAQNALLVYSNLELFNHLKQKVDMLDKPIPNIAFDPQKTVFDQSNVNNLHIQTTNAPLADATDTPVTQEMPGENVAQPAAAQQVETKALEWREIPVHNIKPTWLAFWLDSAHQPMPAEYKAITGLMSQYFMQKAIGTQPKIISEPKSEKITTAKPDSYKIVSQDNPIKPLDGTLFADNTRHVLWFQSTPEKYDELKRMVEFLDRPIRKIDFDLNMVEMDSKYLPATKTTDIGFTEGSNFQSILNSLIAAGKAKTIRSSQLSILNNLTQGYSTSTSTPVSVEIKQADGGNEILNTASDKDNQLFLEKRFSLILTPTINNDDTVTLFFSKSVNAQLTHQTPPAEDDNLWIKNLMNEQPVPSVIIIRNNQTVAFSGFDSTMLGLDKGKHNVVVFLTAHIVQ